MTDDEDDALTRLDPDAAAQAGATAPGDPGTHDPASPGDAASPLVVDVRRYRWAIGIIGLVIAVAISVALLTTHHPSTAGVAAGGRLHWFAAPLAASDLQGDPNLRPPCTLAQHDPRALNLCLDAQRSALVISFFVPQSRACVRQVDALQTLSRRTFAAPVQFMAVAVGTSHARAAALVRREHWTIQVAYDADGAVGGQYGVVACPMAELASRGGIVRDRLIGDHWATSTALAAQVGALVGSAR